MKLKRENFKKQEFGSLVTYSYECNGMTFFLQVDGYGDGKQKTISVFKGRDRKSVV